MDILEAWALVYKKFDKPQPKITVPANADKNTLLRSLMQTTTRTLETNVVASVPAPPVKLKPGMAGFESMLSQPACSIDIAPKATPSEPQKHLDTGFVSHPPLLNIQSGRGTGPVGVPLTPIEHITKDGVVVRSVDHVVDTGAEKHWERLETVCDDAIAGNRFYEYKYILQSNKSQVWYDAKRGDEDGDVQPITDELKPQVIAFIGVAKVKLPNVGVVKTEIHARLQQEASRDIGLLGMGILDRSICVIVGDQAPACQLFYGVGGQQKQVEIVENTAAVHLLTTKVLSLDDKNFNTVVL
eukprot:TRINITY_DN59543_c0_g1_i1.p1 TRINITY_DN59543_c0_g1~~TRINITY_DN59543_c0_g1_i1.p1  ORF type:complete len:308 (-),score=31.04 TRINITY_DN59543_c0_g1_i1:150-1046(-)